MKAVQLGLCFQWAYKKAVEYEVKAYHALISQPFTKGSYPHAWIEKGGIIQDYQTMELGYSLYAKVGWPKELFYEIFNPQDVKEYTASQLIHLVATRNHMGPYGGE